MSHIFDVYRYTLHSSGPVNAKTSRRSYTGALLRSEGGYGCLHPWPELGDGTLDDALCALATGRDTALTRATRRCLRLDATARRSQRWLFEGGPPPPASHATLPNASLEMIEDAVRRGFKAIKVKGSPDRLENLRRLLHDSPLPLRIDFNETMSVAGLITWNDTLTAQARAKLDFVEDPCPYDSASWTHLAEATGWRLALDRQGERAEDGFDVMIIKPAVCDLERIESQLEERPSDFVVTSYMDHPLGQAYAAFEAARLSKRFPQYALLGGLATHQVFRSLPEALHLGDTPNLTLPRGTGLGFDDYLHALPWEPLTF